MAEVQVHTAGGEYTVYIGRRVYEGELVETMRRLRPGKTAILSHPSIDRMHGRRLRAAVAALSSTAAEPLSFLFPEGEENKNLQTLEKAYVALLSGGVVREDVVLAFGGGVVGDLAGFAASTYMRGIRFLQIPTTLMAMVDSSVGGKVGVDLPGAKNAVGSFYQPQAVISDLEVLDTLPEREFRSGLAEVVKYGFLYDENILETMEGWTAGMPEADAELEDLIARCVEHKARVVTLDELDLRGERAMLNYGHTFGHALESAAGYGRLRHGEAVAMGMLMAARASEMSGLAGSGLMEMHRKAILPVLGEVRLPSDLGPKRILADMQADKKKTRGLRFVLLEGPRKPHLVESLSEEIVRKAVSETLEELKEG
jgi:3-dehydroquinate synthase